jgi:hypothetical protein
MTFMRVSSLAVLITSCSLVLPGVASAQSLAEAAAKEKERRKTRTGKVFTEEDARRAGASRPRDVTIIDGAAAPDAAAKEGTPKEGAAKEGAEKPKEETRADQEKAWRDRLTKANADVAKLTTQADGIQRSLNDLTQNVYGSTRTAQMARLEETKKQLATAQQSVEAITEEGRRSGFRP